MNMTWFYPFAEGFIIMSGLIVAIGAQNAFVLKQGVQQNHVGLIALICASIDAILISVGVGGLGAIIASNEIVLMVSRWGGAIFLACYGLRSFWMAFKNQSLKIDSKGQKLSLKKLILMSLAVSLLNPHVYIDTCMLIGSVGAQFPAEERPFFAFGASLVSFIWFFTIGYGAKSLIPLFKKPAAWKIFDCTAGVMMICIAVSLVIQ
jgi:L-lysine exporter family protein LysE/ArgO